MADRRDWTLVVMVLDLHRLTTPMANAVEAWTVPALRLNHEACTQRDDEILDVVPLPISLSHFELRMQSARPDQHFLAGHPRIRQRKERDDLRSVLGQDPPQSDNR